jgi:putative two-component system response regulator
MTTKLMVVDDEPDMEALMRQYYRRQIRSGEYAFQFASNGEHALRVLDLHKDTDVVLTDINMPIMDGLTLIPKLSVVSPVLKTIVVSAYGDMDNIRAAMNRGAHDFVMKPIEFGDLDTTLKRTIEHVAQRKQALQTYEMNELLKIAVDQKTRRIKETEDATIMSLAHLAEVRDLDTGRHLDRTRQYVRLLAEALRSHPRFVEFIDDEAVETLYKSAPLHDIGKVGVPDFILRKEGMLSDEEYRQMKLHVDYGADVLRSAEERLGFNSFLAMAQRIAHQHHEKWDGTGYPRGLKGEEIHYAARLMSLADVYDALTTRRPYKDAWSHNDVRDFLIAQSGLHFDPAVVEAFLAREAEFQTVAEHLKD